MREVAAAGLWSRSSYVEKVPEEVFGGTEEQKLKGDKTMKQTTKTHRL